MLQTGGESNRLEPMSAHSALKPLKGVLRIHHSWLCTNALDHWILFAGGRWKIVIIFPFNLLIVSCGLSSWHLYIPFFFSETLPLFTDFLFQSPHPLFCFSIDLFYVWKCWTAEAKYGAWTKSPWNESAPLLDVVHPLLWADESTPSPPLGFCLLTSLPFTLRLLSGNGSHTILSLNTSMNHSQCFSETSCAKNRNVDI